MLAFIRPNVDADLLHFAGLNCLLYSTSLGICIRRSSTPS
jgi:hypothetical protein